ncbi:MAG: hypothetical protein RLZZ206_814 [Cyanobacteriota bacterium]|jgi:nucleotidyltransferase substrate binding protein (TIGR01987 family)
MSDADVCWRQRFDNFQRALLVLERGVELARQRPLSELEQQGLIQGFEFSHELAWNLLKNYLQHQGIAGIIGSRDATRLAFQNDLISDGEGALRDRFIAAIRQLLASHREVEAAILYGSRPAAAAA